MELVNSFLPENAFPHEYKNIATLIFIHFTNIKENAFAPIIGKELEIYNKVK